MSPAEPRILYLALGCAKRLENARAVLETWGADVAAPSRVVILGDAPLANALGAANVWSCVEAGGPHDNYLGLPIKMREAFRQALADPDWDFLVKLDDDTLVVPARMSALLKELNPREIVFAGGRIMRAKSDAWQHPRLNEKGPFTVPFFSGGGGYVLSRPALEKAWSELEPMLSIPGAEDVYVAGALFRAGIPMLPHPHHFRNVCDAERLFWGATATIHHVTKENLRLFHRLFAEQPPQPFAIANATTGWGEIGVGGVLGYEGKSIVVDGKPYRKALSAHAPSELVLRGTPGLRLELRGALNDSVPARVNVWAHFTVQGSDGRAIVELGRASRGTTTDAVTVRFPEDGRLRLVARESAKGHCHSVWLWDAPEWVVEATTRRVA